MLTLEYKARTWFSKSLAFGESDVRLKNVIYAKVYREAGAVGDTGHHLRGHTHIHHYVLHARRPGIGDAGDERHSGTTRRLTARIGH